MVRTIVAVTGGVALGLVIAFANAGAFPFWSDTPSPGASTSPGAPMEAQQAQGSQMQPSRRPPTLRSLMKTRSRCLHGPRWLSV